ncbi:hypothetical protein JAAARDRAFT_30367 [Jaapia argillacea MUCL 33604]|uniref:Uncharacterized protein n=1 Tax=Jaapia argillacea MUCL 33604 TaxID=933084 RepID=A0A067Q610_9AGAM|nr:hypothetical protein JAAARDRAFT_30367 [Jaapia argillacea MUCL 33604]
MIGREEAIKVGMRVGERGKEMGKGERKEEMRKGGDKRGKECMITEGGMMTILEDQEKARRQSTYQLPLNDSPRIPTLPEMTTPLVTVKLAALAYVDLHS